MLALISLLVNYRDTGCMSLCIISFLQSVWRIDNIIGSVVVAFKGEYKRT